MIETRRMQGGNYRRLKGVMHCAHSVLLFALVVGCANDAKPESASPPTMKELGTASSIEELRDAFVAAGYECMAWNQDNVVSLAAESGNCDDQSVISTYASEGDLQSQLDIEKAASDLLIASDIEPDPFVVGPNWIFKAPDAAEYADAVGGIVVRPES